VRPISKITRAKRTGSVAQGVELLLGQRQEAILNWVAQKAPEKDGNGGTQGALLPRLVAAAPCFCPSAHVCQSWV
jgi:hypothetical protein